MKKILIAFLLVLPFLGCKKSSDSSSSAPPPVPESNYMDVSGTWIGAYMVSVSTKVIGAQMNLVQDVSSATGNFVDEFGGGGTIEGTSSDDEFTFEFKWVSQTCPGSFTGSADINDKGQLQMSFTGSSCLGAMSGAGLFEKR